MSLTDLMPSTKDRLIDALKAELTKTNALLARGVTERDQAEATPGSPLWDSRVHLGRDGKTGARDVNADQAECTDDMCWNEGGVCTGRSSVPVVLSVDPGAQVEQSVRHIASDGDTATLCGVRITPDVDVTAQPANSTCAVCYQLALEEFEAHRG